MPSKKKERRTVIELLREAIQTSGMGVRELGRASGVDPSRISRFVRGQSKIDIAAASAICESLGYTLTKTRSRPAKKKDRTKPTED